MMPSSQGRVLMNQIKMQLSSSNILRPCQSSSIESIVSLMLRPFSSIREGNPNPRTFNNNTNSRRQREGENWNQNLEEPEPNTNPRRPLRGERLSGSNFYSPPTPPTVNVNPSPTPTNQKVGNRNDDAPSLSDYDFLDKFKLAVDNKDTQQQPSANGPSTTTTNVTMSTTSTELPQKDHQPNNKTNAQDQPQDADEIFEKMKETGLIPNAVAMLDGLCKDGLVQEAMKLFGLMREKGTIPEVVIYTAVVDGFCKAHKLDDAKRIFRKMQNNGIIPNAFSYGILIQGLCKCNKLDGAVEFAVEMLEAGHSPNVTTFVGLVDGICKEKGVEEAQSVITRLRQKGFFLNEKAVREHLDKKAPFLPSVWEAIFGKKTSQRPF